MNTTSVTEAHTLRLVLAAQQDVDDLCDYAEEAIQAVARIPLGLLDLLCILAELAAGTR
jgi:hypothetical protein